MFANIFRTMRFFETMTTFIDLRDFYIKRLPIIIFEGCFDSSNLNVNEFQKISVAYFLARSSKVGDCQLGDVLCKNGS